jgi:hypothetical protein
MPATIHRAPKALVGRTLIASKTSIDRYGLVTVSANYLLNSQNDLQFLQPDAPVNDAFQGLPPLQGGLFVLQTDAQKRDGLLYADVQLVGAINPPRYVVFDGEDVRSYTGPRPIDPSGGIDGTSRVFIPYRTDYFAPFRSITYVTMKGNTAPPVATPPGQIKRFNTRKAVLRYLDGEGVPRILEVFFERSREELITQISQQEIGQVVRSTITTSKILVALEPGEVSLQQPS